MATLPDHMLHKHHRVLVEPFDPAQVNPASYDVRIGDEILIEREYTNGKLNWRRINMSKGDDFYTIKPNQFVLAHTMETIMVPDTMEAVFQLKSSRGREGFQHMLAAYIDPGFTGKVTLELKNCSQYRYLRIYPGMPIGQVRWSALQSATKLSYKHTGHYMGADTVQPSWEEDSDQ